MNIAIVGSRHYNDYNQFETLLNQLIINENLNITSIISGGSKGVDSLAEIFALNNDIKFIKYTADWKHYGKSAGPIRNKLIIDHSDYVIAFWDGKSKGTLNSLNLANKSKDKEYVKIISIK